MEINQHSIPEILADTEKWELIIRAPYPVQLNIVRFLNVRQLFIAHYSFPELRLAIQNPSQPYQRITLMCNVDVHENSLDVSEVVKIDESTVILKTLFSIRAIMDLSLQKANKEMFIFGPIDSGTDIVFCKDAKQGVANILNTMWTIWPSACLELIVREKVPREYLHCSVFRETSSLLVSSYCLFEDMELICLYAKKINYLHINARLPNFDPKTVLNIDDVIFENAYWLKVSHLICHIPAKKAHFAATNLDSRDCNTIICSYQQKTLSFIQITIKLNSVVDIQTVLENTVYLRVNHSEGQDEEVEVDRKAEDGDEFVKEDYYCCYYILTRRCEEEEWKLLRVTIMNCNVEEVEGDGVDRMLKLEVVPTSSFPRTFEILNCLNEKKKTEAEIRRLTADIELATVDLESYGGTDSKCEEAKKLKKLLAEHNNEKRKMMEKLEEIEKDLSAANVECEDNVYQLFRSR